MIGRHFGRLTMIRVFHPAWLLAPVALAGGVPLAGGVTPAADTVHLPAVGTRYASELGVNVTLRTGARQTYHVVLLRTVVAGKDDVIETSYEGTSTPSGGTGFPVSGNMTYRLFLLTDNKATAQPVPDKPATKIRRSLDCPADGLDGFWPRGTGEHVAMDCAITLALGDRVVVDREKVTVNVTDLGPGRDTTKAGTFEIRKIAVQYSAPEVTSQTVNDFAPALGISVVQDQRELTTGSDSLIHSEVTALNPAH